MMRIINGTNDTDDSDEKDENDVDETRANLEEMNDEQVIINNAGE